MYKQHKKYAFSNKTETRLASISITKNEPNDFWKY